MNSKVVFGQYYHVDSWLHRLDPRTKILATLFLIIAIFLLENTIYVGIALTVTLILILTSKIPIKKFLQSLKMMMALLFITVFFQLFFNRGQVLKELHFTLTVVNLIIIILLLVFFIVSSKFIRSHRFLLFLLLVIIGFLSQSFLVSGKALAEYSLIIYQEGMVMALKIVFRIITLILLSSLLTLTTKPSDLNTGLERLAKPLKYIGIKVSILSMMISIALRFIPTLINEAGRILKAQASRGTDFKEGKLREKVTQIVSLLVPMFVISYRRAYELADAMEARGYIPEGERSSINLLRYRFGDYLTIIMVLGLFAGVIVLKVMHYAI